MIDRATGTTSGTALPRTRLALWITAAALIGVLAGFLLQYGRLQRAQRDLDALQAALAAARLETTLSAAVIEAQSGRYEAARQRSSDFFTGVQRRLLPVIAAEQREATRRLLTERDSLITSLARNDPSSPGTLASLLMRLREILRQAQLDAEGSPGAPPA